MTATEERTAATLPPECRHTARTSGLVPALALLCAGALPGLLPCGPAGHAVVPAEVAATADRVWLAGAVSERVDGAEETLSTVALPEGTLTVLRHCPPFGAAFDGGSVWALGLVWLRLGLSERLLDACLRHLGDRVVGDTTLLRLQLVQGALADALIEQAEVRAVLASSAPAGAGLTRLHDQVTRADRVLLRLLGAAGFLTGGPGEVAHLSELLADTYSGEPA